jgi:hypothetical protein
MSAPAAARRAHEAVLEIALPDLAGPTIGVELAHTPVARVSPKVLFFWWVRAGMPYRSAHTGRQRADCRRHRIVPTIGALSFAWLRSSTAGSS